MSLQTIFLTVQLIVLMIVFNVLPSETSTVYLKLKDDNKSFVNQTINHLYIMQNKIKKITPYYLVLLYIYINLIFEKRATITSNSF